MVTNKANHHENRIHLKASDKALMVFNYVFVTLVAMLMLYPILNILAVSLSNYYEYLKAPWMIIPKRLNLEAYKYVFYNASFWRSYGNTIIVTGAGTLIGLALTIVTAYPLSRPMLRLKPLWMTLIIFTMVFNAGMIPNFLNIRNLGMYNSLWALILPGAFGAFNCILMLNFFKEIPQSLTEAAEIDGASEPRILFGIVVPLSKSVIATIALFLAVSYWNSYFSAQIYLKSSEKWPLALMLKEILLSASTKALEAANDAAAMDQTENQLETTTLQYACIIVSMVPIMCVYPFLQKYFTKGVMLGGVKG